MIRRGELGWMTDRGRSAGERYRPTVRRSGCNPQEAMALMDSVPDPTSAASPTAQRWDRLRNDSVGAGDVAGSEYDNAALDQGQLQEEWAFIEAQSSGEAPKITDTAAPRMHRHSIEQLYPLLLMNRPTRRRRRPAYGAPAACARKRPSTLARPTLLSTERLRTS